MPVSAGILSTAAGTPSPAATTPPQPTAPKIVTTETSTELNDWLFFTLKGLASPGTITRDGFRGFDREIGWDKKKGKGSQGATMTLKDLPPCEGSFTIQLIGPGGFYQDGTPSRDLANWDNFVAQVLNTPSTDQQAQGLPIYYPGLSSVGVTKVVIGKWSPPRHVGKGMYQVTIPLIEWSQPPAASVVSTVATTAADVPSDNQPAPIDPTTLAQTQTIAVLQRAAQP